MEERNKERKREEEKRMKMNLAKACVFHTRAVVCGKRWLRTIHFLMITSDPLIIREGLAHVADSFFLSQFL